MANGHLQLALSWLFYPSLVPGPRHLVDECFLTKQPKLVPNAGHGGDSTARQTAEPALTWTPCVPLDNRLANFVHEGCLQSGDDDSSSQLGC